MFINNTPFNKNRMETLKITRKNISLDDELVGMAVEKILSDNADLRFQYKEKGSLRDIQNKVFGLNTYIYEVKNQGAIVYQKYNVLGKYISSLHFLGFNPKSKTYNTLKTKLEEIANTQDSKKLRSMFK